MRIELFFGVKSRSNLIPVYSVTADCSSLYYDLRSTEPLAIIFKEMPLYLIPEQNPFRGDSYSYQSREEHEYMKSLFERKCTLNNTLKNLYRNILQECSAEFFKTDLPCDASSECTTLEELCKKLDSCFSALAQKQENWNKPRWYCREWPKSDYDQEHYPKDQIFVQRYVGNDRPTMNFGITLSDDGTQMDIYVDFYRNGEIALFTLPVSAYPQFCDFAYAAYQYVQEKILTYSLPEKEAAELKTFQTEILQYCIWKSMEYRKADKNGGIQAYSFSNAQGQPADKSPLGKLHHSLNPNAPEDRLYTEPKGEVLTVDAHVFKERMKALECSDWNIASSYSEIIEVNGIRQIILSTGIDAVHIQLAVTLNDSLTELEVYLDEKTEPAEQPLFVLNSSDYALLETFFAELKAHQVEDMRVCNRNKIFGFNPYFTLRRIL